MKELLVGGKCLLTSDDIADAVLDYGDALERAGRQDTIEFPVIADGTLRTCRMRLTSAVALSSLSVPDGELWPPLDGAPHAEAEIRRRTREVLDQTTEA